MGVPHIPCLLNEAFSYFSFVGFCPRIRLQDPRWNPPPRAYISIVDRESQGIPSASGVAQREGQRGLPRARSATGPVPALQRTDIYRSMLSRCVLSAARFAVAAAVAALELGQASLADEGAGTADFVFADFNYTHGLTFVGSSATTACINATELSYGNVHGDADQLEGSPAAVMREVGEEVATEDVSTSKAGEHASITSHQAGFGNRQAAGQSPDAEGRRCRVRSRLTPSLPSKAGAMWYSVPVPVTRGFETLFTFQITDHSKLCTEHADPLFSRQLHSTCSVQGGDGLAFVLHRDPREAEAVGGTGADIGYGGVMNSLAVELDHRYNAGDASGDLVYDHVGIHSSGRGSNNSALATSELVPPVAWDLADGQHHLVKVNYFPRVATEYLHQFSATPNLVPYLKDGGEGRRLGTLVVWIDDGIAADEPLLAVPINLSVLLDLPQDKAFVGLTAGTGRAWAKHDVLAWYWCHNDGGSPGQEGSGDKSDESWNGCGETKEFSTFSYGQSTEYHPNSRLRRSDVELHGGGGYGGGEVDSEATKVVPVPKGYWASSGSGGGWDGDAGQVPPATEN